MDFCLNRFKYYATFEKLTFAYTLIHVCNYKISVRIRTTMNWLLATTFFIFQKTIRNFFLLLCFSRKKKLFCCYSVLLLLFMYFVSMCAHMRYDNDIFFKKKVSNKRKNTKIKKKRA